MGGTRHVDGGFLPAGWKPFEELPLVERLYEISNQLGGHVDTRTSERDAAFLLKLSAHAAEAAEEVAGIEARASEVVGWRVVDPETGACHMFARDDEVFALEESARLGAPAPEPLALAVSR